ncbi:MAG TPA: dihydroorotate dehydrogenase [Petrotogaceae bacterium]|jgi:dihydroorotate dehydrogenase (NAD+) catalytic subunit|nr:dihydroorotate dehydrogenase [Petrotogaceae bacterium]HQO12493.1 dihydroorotate dehydrogenase [Petrotogaceae bacterium]HQP58428.1 dihydroorotate dehydrogenase [Petrotogaceae bacterium]
MTETKICGINFKNPVIAASGTFGFGREFSQAYDLSKLGGICTKGLTFNPRQGNKGIRCCETASGMINSVGLQNPGIQSFLDNDLAFMSSLNTVIIANLSGSSIQEYVQGAELLNSSNVDMIELNISCPNVKEGGMNFGIKTQSAVQVLGQVRKAVSKPLIVKLSPNAEDIVDMAVTCEKNGADGISLVNTFKAMAIDIYKRKPIFKNITAGLSGPCIKPIALRMVYEVSKAVNIPVIGMGGISCWQDAVEFIMAGACAVQIGTMNFIKPDICLDIINGIEMFMEKNNFNSISEMKSII